MHVKTGVAHANSAFSGEKTTGSAKNEAVVYDRFARSDDVLQICLWAFKKKAGTCPIKRV